MDIVVWLRSLGLDEASGVESEAGIAAAVVNVPVLVTPRLAAATAKATPAAWRCSRRCAKFRLVYRCSLRFAARHLSIIDRATSSARSRAPVTTLSRLRCPQGEWRQSIRFARSERGPST